jgi:hypothetical protein
MLLSKSPDFSRGFSFLSLLANQGHTASFGATGVNLS